jgi:hypothetical protein
MGFFSTDSEKQRQIILGDIKQTPPTGNLKVVDANQKTLESGGVLILLTLETRSGEKVVLNCFERDLKKCISQWGSENNPTTWDEVKFEKNWIGTRWQLVPAAAVVLNGEAV